MQVLWWIHWTKPDFSQFLQPKYGSLSQAPSHLMIWRHFHRHDIVMYIRPLTALSLALPYRPNMLTRKIFVKTTSLNTLGGKSSVFISARNTSIISQELVTCWHAVFLHLEAVNAWQHSLKSGPHEVEHCKWLIIPVPRWVKINSHKSIHFGC